MNINLKKKKIEYLKWYLNKNIYTLLPNILGVLHVN